MLKKRSLEVMMLNWSDLLSSLWIRPRTEKAILLIGQGHGEKNVSI